VTPRVLRPVGHEDRLSIIDHLDELRSRLMVCGAALVIAFFFCFWQNHVFLNLLNAPLKHVPAPAANHIGGLVGDNARASHDFAQAAALINRYARQPDVSLSDSALLAAIGSKLGDAAKALPQKQSPTVPITIGPGEPFTTTITVCFYAALLIALPVILYELYAFVIPALSEHERRAAMPVMIAAPLLFVIGVVFTYIVVMPAAIRFLQGYNNTEFQNLVQAKPLYAFEVATMGAIGLAFQLPIGLLGLQRVGYINGSTLTRHWRYATVIIAIIAAAMPGADPVTTGLETLPLVILFLASIVMLKIVDRRDAKRALAELTTVDDGPSPGGSSAV
jgi:sec-independent protein translocase protein TatC